MKLKAWNKIEFGHVGNKIAELQKHLEWLETQPGTPNNVQDMKETQMKLNCWNENRMLCGCNGRESTGIKQGIGIQVSFMRRH